MYNTEHQPSLAVYLRTSKSNTNQTNVSTQVTKLREAVNHFIQSEDYWLNGSYIYHDELTLEEDINKSGNTINEGLKRFLKSLSYGDTVIVQDISRLSRMDIRDDEFTDMVSILFDNDRSVFTTGYNGEPPVHVTRGAFIEMAIQSNETYIKICECNHYGNEVKATTKEHKLDECLRLCKLGLSPRAISLQMLKSRAQVYRYKQELRSRKLIK